VTEAERATLRTVVIPFIIFTTIWGTTWIVIRDQLGEVPAQWSITYRFLIAAAAMAALTRWKGESLRLGWAGIGAAALLGFLQFVINFTAVYLAEHHITSGLVATVFALLLIPNSLLGWAFLGQKPGARFTFSSLFAVAGVAMLFAHELGEHPGRTDQILLGIALTLAGVFGRVGGQRLPSARAGEALSFVRVADLGDAARRADGRRDRARFHRPAGS
jgi:drug/metabolite transporter (DMT)-like permease